MGQLREPKPKKSKDKAKLDPNDISERLACYVSKNPGEIVRARKVGAINYRINWYKAKNEQGEGGIDMTIHQPHRSQFVVVTPPHGRTLNIRVVSEDTFTGKNKLI